MNTAGRTFAIDMRTSLSLSQHNSNIPNNTLLTSKYGSHTAKPRPIKSTAALRSAITILVNLDKLLFPMPKPSTIELFLLTEEVPEFERLDVLTLSDALTSWPNSAPITPIKITAVICLRRNSLTDDDICNEINSNLLLHRRHQLTAVGFMLPLLLLTAYLKIICNYFYLQTMMLPTVCQHFNLNAFVTL
ncbi:hypothetical protein AGLY_001910 [Aphis glycines]|uniref:Uncharacterized protein n=1 Tax=Aphis glycines TaxID=307491 RepID=A0A6G0U6M2_APHGL|nr:hypothetical protein AGLY_001910 [Aphis glycines]